MAALTSRTTQNQVNTSIPFGTELKGTQGRFWKVGKKVGQGRCCVAYEASLVGEEDVQAVVKIFHPQSNFSAACQREGKLLDILQRGTCGSKYLVKKYDEYCHQENDVLVCELLGESLHFLLAHHVDEKMSLWMIQKILRDILIGLEILNIRGFVHADVKPGNVHWCPDEYCAKLIDYGLTFHIQDKVKGVVQSSHYRAPESGETDVPCVNQGSVNILKQNRLSDTDHAGASAGLANPAVIRCTSTTVVNSDSGPDTGRDQLPPSLSTSAASNQYSTTRDLSNFSGNSSNHSLTLCSAKPQNQKLPEPRNTPCTGELLGNVSKTTTKRGTIHYKPITQAGVGACGLVPGMPGLSSDESGADVFLSPQASLTSNLNQTCSSSSVDSVPSTSATRTSSQTSYSAVNELERITRTVCNCTTCGRHLSPAIDIWSVGCLIVEMFRGRNGANFGGRTMCDNCRSVDSQMLCEFSVNAGGFIKSRTEDECIENCDVKSVIKDLRDLVQRTLMCQPIDRIPVSAAVSHAFFHHPLRPSYRDMLLLPSRVLCLLNMADEGDLENEEELSDIEDDIEDECEKYGEVEECVLCRAGPEKCKVFVLFTRSRDCIHAWKQLNGRTFNSRTVITCYYPLDKFRTEILPMRL